MIIIADSGSTKTNWALLHNDNEREELTTIGLNPYHTSPTDIEKVCNVVSSHVNEDVEGIYFYGSGITPQMRPMIKEILSIAFGNGFDIQAESDILGAARAIFGNREGIACILGTGANSSYYDGHDIVYNTPAMGYILGDEGSGSCIGKHLLNALYKDNRLAALCTVFEDEYNLNLADIIEHVYRHPLANRFLASFAPFAKKHIDNKLILSIVRQDFSDFFTHNFRNYPTGLPVGFIGSIAFHFKPQLQAVARKLGYMVTSIQQSPIEGLLQYHTKTTLSA